MKENKLSSLQQVYLHILTYCCSDHLVELFKNLEVDDLERIIDAVNIAMKFKNNSILT